MPYYYFEAATADGQIQKKILKARDKKEADQQLRHFGLRPIVIESAQVVRKKKQEQQLATRRVIKGFLRKTFFFVAGISLVGGIATYLVLLDVSRVERLDVSTLSRSGIVAQSTNIINAETPEEREFGREVFGLWEMSFPDSLSGIEIKHKGLMLVYVKQGKDRFGEDSLRALASTITRAFQRRFQTANCIVLIAHESETIAESRFQDGNVNTVVY
ncbi:MAG: hypothetical protein HY801_00385 [Candidatus Lindowbacteria bacterium]|nr:hypothetical protein [Candidatus Lindowbacteria bacterium]